MDSSTDRVITLLDDRTEGENQLTSHIESRFPAAQRPGQVVWDDSIGDGVDLLSPLAYRVESTEILFQKKIYKPKFIGHDDRYILGDFIGEGCYSKVKEVMDMKTLRRAAVKIMTQKRLRKIPNGEENAQREMTLLRKLSSHPHENVIHMYDLVTDSVKQKFYVILEYCAIVMQELIENAPNKRLPIFQAHSYFVQLIAGLDHLHSLGIIHKDIKPGNLLINNSNIVKICDFGVAEMIDRFQSHDMCTVTQGSPAFQPPEIASGVDSFSGSKVDIWSSGVTLYNLVSGTYPFDGDTIFRLFERISACVLPEPLPDPIPSHDELEDLLRKILTKDPLDRLSISAIRRHNWVARRHHPQSESEKLVWMDQLPLLSGQSLPGRSTTVEPYLEVYYNTLDGGDNNCEFDDELQDIGEEEEGVVHEYGDVIFKRDPSFPFRLHEMATHNSSAIHTQPPKASNARRAISQPHYNVPPPITSGSNRHTQNQEPNTSNNASANHATSTANTGPTPGRRHSSAAVVASESVGDGTAPERKKSFLQIFPNRKSKSLFLGCIGIGNGRRKTSVRDENVADPNTSDSSSRCFAQMT